MNAGSSASGFQLRVSYVEQVTCSHRLAREAAACADDRRDTWPRRLHLSRSDSKQMLSAVTLLPRECRRADTVTPKESLQSRQGNLFTVFCVVRLQDNVRLLPWQDGSATEREGSPASRLPREGATAGARAFAGDARVRCRDSRQPSLDHRTRRGESFVPRPALAREGAPGEHCETRQRVGREATACTRRGA